MFRGNVDPRPAADSLERGEGEGALARLRKIVGSGSSGGGGVLFKEVVVAEIGNENGFFAEDV
jgi:hypothetical protein